jgi:hypothetical protein
MYAKIFRACLLLIFAAHSMYSQTEKLELLNQPDYDQATLNIPQNITFISDTSIVFDFNAQGLENKSCIYYLFVTNADGQRNEIGYPTYYQGNPVFTSIHPYDLAETDDKIVVQGMNFGTSEDLATSKLELVDEPDYCKGRIFSPQKIVSLNDITMEFKAVLHDLPQANRLYYLFFTNKQGLRNEIGYPAFVSKTALSVKLTGFQGQQKDDNVLLTWNTISEFDSYGFEIHRRYEKEQNFSKIGFVDSIDKPDPPRGYQYIDSPPQFGVYFYRLRQVDYNGNFKNYEPIQVNFIAPTSFRLDQNFPNPFNPSTTISYHLPRKGSLKIAIYDMIGRPVRLLLDEDEAMPGFWQVVWNGRDDSGEIVPSGQYAYILSSGNKIVKRKMMFIK